MEEVVYRLITRNRPRLLFAMMRALAAADSQISFEGALSSTELARLEDVSHERDGCPKTGHAST